MQTTMTSKKKTSQSSSTSNLSEHSMEVDETPSPMSSQVGSTSDTTNTSFNIFSVDDQVVPSEVQNSPGPSSQQQQQQNQVMTSKDKTTNETNTCVPATKSNRRGRPRRVKKDIDDTNNSVTSADDDSNLFNLIFSKMPLSEIIDNWIDEYKKDKENGLLLMIQFIIDATSSKEKLTRELLLEKNTKELIDYLDNNITSTTNYPLMNTKNKEYRKTLSKFIKNFVKKCQNDILFDEYILDNIILFLINLSHSKVQSYRHTATFLCLKLTTSLVDICLNLSQLLAKMTKHYDIEKKKPKNNRAIDKLDVLEHQKFDTEEHIDNLQNKITYIFNNVLVIRSRDVIQDIRLICVSAIGSWIKKNPNTYVIVDYLKYIGWALFDDEKDGVIRKKSLDILTTIYNNNEYFQRMLLFTKKYKKRIIAMTLDTDLNVAKTAISVVTLIDTFFPDILSDEERETMYKLIFVKDRTIAQAAGEYLDNTIKTDIHSTYNTEKLNDNKYKKLINTSYLKILVMFFIESDYSKDGSYLVDAVINVSSAIEDWECITHILLNDKEDEKFDDTHQTGLVKILSSCIKQLCTGEIPEARRTTTKRPLNSREKQLIENYKTSITEYFAVELTKLLIKYQDDKDKLPYLLSIPQYFNFNIYITLRLDKHLELLLKIIDKIVKNVYDEFTQETAAKTLELICCKNSPVAFKCNPLKFNLIDFIIYEYTDARKKIIHAIDNNNEPTDEELYKITESMMKLSKFYGCHNMNRYELLETFYKNITDYYHKLPDIVIKYSIDCCYFSLLWDLYSLKSDNTLNPQDNSTLLQTLQLELNAFIIILKDILNDEIKYSELIKGTSFSAMCDLIIDFDNDTSINESLQNLPHYEVDETTEKVLYKFIKKYVYCRFDDINNKKRNFLSNYCKLIIRQRISLKSTSIIFINYKKYYNDYGDIAKDVLGVFRDYDRIQFAGHMLISLISLYEKLPTDIETEKIHNKMKKIKDLASRLALLIGLDNKKNQTAMITVHKDGILFALTGLKYNQPDDYYEIPSNITFFEIISVFIRKLMKCDKSNILNYLEEKLPENKSSGEGWEPVIMYRNGLRSKKPRTQNNSQTISQIEQEKQVPEGEEPESEESQQEKEEEREKNHSKKNV